MEGKKKDMNIVDEKLEKILNDLMRTISHINVNLSQLQRQASLKEESIFDDYEDIADEVEQVRKEVDKLEYKFQIETLSLYLIFLDLKLSFHILQNKLEVTNYLIQLFTRQ